MRTINFEKKNGCQHLRGKAAARVLANKSRQNVRDVDKQTTHENGTAASSCLSACRVLNAGT